MIQRGSRWCILKMMMIEMVQVDIRMMTFNDTKIKEIHLHKQITEINNNLCVLENVGGKAWIWRRMSRTMSSSKALFWDIKVGYTSSQLDAS